MFSYLLNLVRQRQRIKRRQRDRHELLNHPMDAVRNVCQAIEQCKAAAFTDSERTVMSRIEAVRDKAIAANAIVHSVDFGAGSPADARNEELSQQGVPYTTSISAICSQGNVTLADRQLLFSLVRQTQPRCVLEMGTSLGFSAAYMCSALKMNEFGSLVTLDGAPELIQIASSHIRELELGDACEFVTGRFSDTLPEVLLKRQPIDLAFIDGHHDGEATLRYFEDFLPHLSEPATLVFDDIHWYQSMKEAWATIAKSPHVVVAIELDAVGICVVTAHKSKPKYIRW
jgi:predicted O-methyltransferase YrrM